ncbi:hypothetical protein [Pseudonocardia yuanmonensis]|uniref:hypothetical protein n=1 Tax=Pseudonocardia yuanmonensis TaxID=1095914 RepID=UPI0031E913B6
MAPARAAGGTRRPGPIHPGGSVARTRRARMLISKAEPGIHAVTIDGTLDAYIGLRLRRLVNARLTLVRCGRDQVTRCLVIDLGLVDRATSLGLEAVIQAGRDTSRTSASFAVVGHRTLFEVLPPEDRATVTAFPRYTGLPEAARALAASARHS